MHKKVVIGAIAIASSAFALAGCGGSIKLPANGSSSASSKNTIAVAGYLEIKGDNYRDTTGGTGTTGDACAGDSGYDDITSGAEVVISDDTGKTLQITQLAAGFIGDSQNGCIYKFTTTVPSGKNFYGVTVTHRGTVKFPESEMAAPAVTLGS